MNNWKKMRLGDVCTIERGGSPRPINDYITQEEDGINWIKIGDTKPNSMYITETKEKIRPSGVKKSRRVYKGDFLLSNSMSFGRPYILAIDGCIHDGWLVIRDENECFDKKFLYFYLGSPNVYAEFTRLAVGGVVNNLNSTLIKNLIVVIPSIAEQRNIAATLDKICETIADRKRQLEQLDLLVKSRFVEMFGDVESNSKKWNEELLSRHLRVVGGYAFRSEGFSERGIPVLRIGNINSGYFKPVNLVFWQYEASLDRYLLYPGDLVISLTGTVGKDDYANVCILGNEYEMYYLNQRNAKLELESTVTNEYLANVLKIPRIKSRLTGISRGVRQANVSNRDILNLVIPIPPLPLQEKFADFVRQVDKSKLEIQQGLEKLELQYNALMQRYFG